jgi:hypothetical protein
MFRFARKPSSGSHSHYLDKITHLDISGYVDLVQDVVSVMAAYCDLLGVCTVHCVRVYPASYIVAMGLSLSLFWGGKVAGVWH